VVNKNEKRTGNMKKIRTFIFILLLFAFVFVSYGCKNIEQNGFGSDTGYVFVPDIKTIKEISGVSGNINNLRIVGSKLYFSASNPGGVRIHMVDISNPDQTDPQGFSFGIGTGGFDIVFFIHADSHGNIWVAERLQSGIVRSQDPNDEESGQNGEAGGIPPMPDFSDIETLFIIRKFDTDGTMQLDIDVTNDIFKDSNSHLSEICVDDDGNIYISSFGSTAQIDVLDPEGRLVFSLDPGHGGNFINHLIRMENGSVSMATNHPTGIIVREISFNSRAFGDTQTLPVIGEYSIYPGNGQFKLLLSNALNLFGVDAETGEIIEILNWIESDVSSAGIEGISLLSNENIVFVRYAWKGYMPQTEFVSLKRTPVNELPQRSVLTLATFDTGQHREPVLEFNRESTTHRIQIIDYSIFNTREDMAAGISRLLTEIIAGNVPDILDVTTLPFDQYAKRGLFVDLYDFIDADPELGRDKFIENILKAAEVNGFLYRMFPSFSISTLAGHPAVLGDQPGWDLDGFKTAIAANPQADFPLGEPMTKEGFLKEVFLLNMEQFVDWDAGNVYFDTGLFKQYLEFADTFPLNPSRERALYSEIWAAQEMLTDGRQILYPMELNDYQQFLLTRTILGGEIVFKGFPAETGNGNAFQINGGLAITTACEDKQGAWEFIRTFLLDTWQVTFTGYNSFPVSRVVFDLKMTTQLAEEGISYMGGPYNETMIHIPHLTQEEAEQITELVNSITFMISFDEALWNIVREGASDYFQGQSTLENTIRIIQSRASIYVSEQSG